MAAAVSARGPRPDVTKRQRFTPEGIPFSNGASAACGGTPTVHGISPDGSTLFGEIDFTGMEGAYANPDLSRLKASFRAARGVANDATTPYGQCTVQYWQRNEQGAATAATVPRRGGSGPS